MNVTQKNLTTLPTGVYPIEANLYFRVKVDGVRYFFYRYQVDGKRKDQSLGSIKKTTLREAKIKASELRVKIDKGEMAVKAKKEKPETFYEFTERLLPVIEKLKSYKDPTEFEKGWVKRLNKYVYPVIGNKLVKDLVAKDILEVLQGLWWDKTPLASSLQNKIETLLRYAVTEGILQSNPAAYKGNLDMYLPRISKVHTIKHQKAVSFEKCREAMAYFATSKSLVDKAIIFGTLTATRVNEFMRARWIDIDFENRIWSIPPEHRKDGKKEPFRVPLSEQAVALLERMKNESPWVFTSTGKAPLARTGAPYQMRLRFGATMHGMRSVFRAWAAEHDVPFDVAETCLMHSVGNKVSRAYQRSDLLDKRREVMQRWADALIERL